MKDWTIDTCVLYGVASNNMNCITFAQKVLQENGFVVFDHERRIDKEYERCFRNTRTEPGHDYLKKWFSAVVGKSVFRFSGKLHNSHKIKLAKLHFGPDDFPFVAVCSRSTIKCLVSEDSDYSVQVRGYLKQKLQIDVLNFGEACKK